MRVSLVLAFLVAVALGPLAVSHSSAQTGQRGRQPQSAPAFSHAAEREKANGNVLMLLGAVLGASYITLANDIAMAVNDGDDLRVMPIVGESAIKNVRDILLLRGVDLGITSVQILNDLKASGEYGPNLERRIAYIAPLSVDMFHLLVRPEIKSLKDLNGKKTGVNAKGSNAHKFGVKVLKELGVQVEEVYVNPSDAVQLMRDGKLDAVLCLCPTPVPAFLPVKSDLGFKFLEIPYIAAFEESYVPVGLPGEAYPNLIAEGSKVQTIATSAVLIAYNWQPGSERYRKIERFVDAFFSNFDKLRQPTRHPSWRDVNIGATIRGWQRFPAAQQWLDRQAAEAKRAPQVDPALARAQAARAAGGDPAEQERLFKEFMEWSRTRPKR
jgi:TRAP-type uncharacterized transport system substrate-binding protein